MTHEPGILAPVTSLMLVLVLSLAYIGCRAQLVDSDLSKQRLLTRLEITQLRFDTGGLLPSKEMPAPKYYPQAISDAILISVANEAWMS